MAREVEKVGITCEGCGQAGTVAKSLVEQSKPTEVKHSVTAGGCGSKFTVGKK